MKWKKWIVYGICFVIMLIYLYIKQTNMVVTWTKPGSDNISENAAWVFGKYSSGKIVHARECLEIAEGSDALDALWPLSLILFIVTLATGVTTGYYFRDNDNAAEHEQELSKLELNYKRKIELSNCESRAAENLEAESRRRIRNAIEKEDDINRREKLVAEKDRDIEKIIEDRVQATKRQLQNLQEDHKNRYHKMESQEKEKIELKLKIISLEKELLLLSEANLTLTREKLMLQKEIENEKEINLALVNTKS